MPNYSIAQLHYTNSYSIKKNQTKLLISHKNLHNGAFARTTDLICNLILQFFFFSMQIWYEKTLLSKRKNTIERYEIFSLSK